MNGIPSHRDGAPANPSRRRFFHWLVAASQGALALLVGLPALAYLLDPLRRRSAGSDWISLGPVSLLRSPTPREVAFTYRSRQGYAVRETRAIAWLVEVEGRLVAYHPSCSHLGCNYRFEAARGTFVCPCHSGQFDLAGHAIAGPPRRPLDRYPVREEEGILYIKPEKVRPEEVA